MDSNELKELQDILDERYVLQNDCNSIVAQTNQKIDDMRVEFVEIKTKLNMIIGICGIICVPIVSIAVKLLFGQ